MVTLDLTTLLIWTLRIVLPILFFGIYFRLQTPNKPRQARAEVPSKHVHSREKLLRHRKAVKASPVPDAMKTIALKDQSQAPQLFGSGRGPRADKGNRRARKEEADEGAERAPKEKEKEKEKEKKEKRERKEQEPSAEATSFSEERMHLESLLNYVAFNRAEEQRIFLPANGKGASSAAPARKSRDADTGKKATIVGAAADKANDEAQMVMRGAMKIKRADVAQNLYDQLIDSQVEVSEGTFKVLVEACVLADDLRGASDFIMKMEDAGFEPQTDILDKVMDLYTKQKEQTEAEEAEKAERAEKAEAEKDEKTDEAEKEEPDSKEKDEPEEAASPGSQKSAAEAPQVPMEYVMPHPMGVPMFNWDAIESSDEEDDDAEPKAPGASTKLSSDAPVFVPSFIPSAPPKLSAEPEEDLASTILSAAATPFEPHNMRFDYSQNTWTPTDWPEEEVRHTEKGKGKGKGKIKGNDWSEEEVRHTDKGKGKGKGKRKGKDKDKDKDKGDWDWEARHEAPHSGEAAGHSREAKSWKKPQSMTWKPKAES